MSDPAQPAAPLQRIAIVFMTGLTETEHVLAAFEAGSSDYVTEPVRPPEVLARIAAHLTAAFPLTPREAEVLFWVGKGKTSRDIGEILGTSPRTVNKHLEHVFEKLGVETRTAAANVAMARIGGQAKE